jgi:hypothetical protein
MHNHKEDIIPRKKDERKNKYLKPGKGTCNEIKEYQKER